MSLLTRLGRSRRFPLPDFELASLEFEVGPALAELGELLLDEPIEQDQAVPGVVTMIQRVPTPGQLSASIDQHLNDREGAAAAAGAAEELRSALAELKRSLA